MRKHLSSQQLSDLAEGLTLPDERQSLDAHLATCQFCLDALAARQAAVGQLREGLPAYLENAVPPQTLRWQNIRDRVPLESKTDRSPKMWRPLRSLAVSAVALAAFAVLATGLYVVFRQVASPASPTPEGQTVSERLFEMSSHLDLNSGPFNEPVDVIVRAVLPEVLDRIPVYRIEPALDDATPDDVRQWAEYAGLGWVRVYRTERPLLMMEDGLVGVNGDWDMISLSSGVLNLVKANFPMSWFFLGVTNTTTDAGVDEASAWGAAEAFVDRLAPHLVTVQGVEKAPQISYAIVPHPDATLLGTGFWSFQVEPVLDGVHVLVEGGRDNMLVVGPAGDVVLAALTPLHLTHGGTWASPRPAEAVVSDFLSGKGSLLRGTRWSGPATPSSERPEIVARAVTHVPGEQIRTAGMVEALSGLDGEPDLLLLRAYTSPEMFVLEGAEPPAGEESSGIQVWGRLGDNEGPGVWRLQVDRLEVTEVRLGVWEGRIEERAATYWFRTYDGQSYYLPDPPQGLVDGAAVGVMGMPSASDETRLEWHTIVLLGGQDLAASQVSRVETQVEAGAEGSVQETARPPVAPAPVPVAHREGAPEGAVESATVVVVGQPAPEPGGLPAWWDHEPGDAVTVEGLLYVHGYEMPDGRVQVFASLAANGPEEGDEIPFLPLAGDDLADLLPLDRLHVRLRAQVLSDEETAARMDGNGYPTSPAGQVLWVDAVEQIWPEEKKQIYEGLARIASVADASVALLDDQRRRQTFALPLDLLSSALGPDHVGTAPVAIIGVQEPGKTVGGFPALRVIELHVGEEQAGALQERLDNPLSKFAPGPRGPSEVIIDEVKLVYRQVLNIAAGPSGTSEADGREAEVLYLLIGRSPDGQHRVTFRLEPFASETLP